MKEGLVRGRFFNSILNQNQGDSETSNFKAGMTSGSNPFGMGDGRVRDYGLDLGRDGNCINTLNNKTKCGFEDRRDLPDKSLITVTVIVGKVGRRVKFDVGLIDHNRPYL